MKTKGVTIISLAIMIVVIIAISSTVIVSTKYIMEETKKDKYVSELELVSSAMQNYITRKSGSIDFNAVNWDLTDIYGGNGDQFEDETISSNILEVYEINLDKIDVDDTYYGNKLYGEADVYLVSLETNRVYYKKGYKYNDNIYYTLSEDIK